MEWMNRKGPGIGLCLILAGGAWLLGKSFPVIGGPVFGIVLGMILTALLPGEERRTALAEGVAFSSKKLLQAAIILLGFEMDLFRVFQVGRESLLLIVGTLAAAFLTAIVIGRFLKTDRNMTILIGVGTAICGGSAIAATAPVIRARDEEIAHAISTIFLFNIGAVFLFPALGHLLGMTDAGFGLFAGTAINDTSSVVAAAAAWSQTAGSNEALTMATIVKLTRTLMIIPITLALSLMTTRRERKDADKNEVGKKADYSIVRIFPWFIIGFLGASLIHSIFPMPELSRWLVGGGKFLIIMAMAGIGWNTNLKRLLTNGFRPILLGLACWFSVSAASVLLQKFLGMW
jgi:uncharacterized integral membrane protein (TIGR00698 family)